ncbi:hypothetical protein PIB30_084233, partial [Stylosanthes scabra]|nr:hypothetical protein [Stylosanthes scabra]
MSGRGGGSSRGRGPGRSRGGGRGRGGGRITVSTTPTNDSAPGSEPAPPPPISAPASSPAPPPTSTEHTHTEDTMSAPDMSEASRIVTDAEGRIRLRLDGKNGKVPIEVRDRWFNKWMESFYFEQGSNPILIRKTFDYRMGRILQQMLRKVRLGNEESTGWMSPTLKREVRNKFATDEGFQRRSATNKVNRASAEGGSLHCGGSATIPSTQERMEKEINREPTIAEVFKQTHTRKRNKEEWVDERSERLN